MSSDFKILAHFEQLCGGIGSDFFSFFCFLGPHPWQNGGSQARGQIRTRPQPEQHENQMASATYTTAHGHTGSLTQ